MKSHLKALVVTFVLFLIIVGSYQYMANRKPPEPAIVKAAEPAQIRIPTQPLVTLTRQTVDLKNFAGKVIIFNFWASWCTPCIEEVPSLVSLVKADADIVIIAVSGDEKSDDIMAFLKSFPGFNKPPIYIVQENAKALMEQFKVDKLPESFIFNPKGEMVKKVSGTINWHTPDSLDYFKTIRAQ